MFRSKYLAIACSVPTVALPVAGLYKANNCTIVLVILDLASSVYSTPGPQILKRTAKY